MLGTARNKLLAAGLAAMTILVATDSATAQVAGWAFRGKAETRRDLVDLASSAGGFSTLLAAVETAGLTDALRGPGPFTIFAPTDDAFGQLDQGLLEALLRAENRTQLQSVLKYHVIPGRLSLREAFSSNTLETLQGSELSVGFDEGSFMVNEVSIVDNDLDSKNGVIHVIDGVLLPPEIKLLDPIASSPRELISLAIDRGVPLFNNQQPQACSAVYEVAVQALLGLSDDSLSERCVTVLRAALNAAGREDDAVTKAWILRHALDYAFTSLPESEPLMRSESATLIDDFSEVNGISDLGTRWRLYTDRVMGGISRATSRYEVLDGKQCLRMQGSVSLENNGGFVQIALSLKPDDQAFDASGYSGVRLWVRGNGRPYYVHLRTTQNRLPWQYYNAPIETDEKWRRIDIPFSEFKVENSRVGLDISKLKRIAVVGAKKEFDADIAVARMEFYR
jgi:uncharacterized surface protein with fasciclin (FAS1) repeats